MGGIAIYLGFTSSMVALTPPWEPLGWIMAGGLLLVGVGMLDDYFAISRGARFAAQMGQLCWRSTGLMCDSMTWVICLSRGACSRWGCCPCRLLCSR